MDAAPRAAVAGGDPATLPLASVADLDLRVDSHLVDETCDIDPITVQERPSPCGTMKHPQSAREIGTGSVLRGRYLIERAIGSGGSSTVFSAMDRHRVQGANADAKVAIKVLRPPFREDPLRVQRMIREFRYMQRLTHAAIARVFDLDCDEGVWFITMELFEGEPLNRYLHRRAAGIPSADALRILLECTQALTCAHEHGVIHGDLKPSNIFIDLAGGAHLLDFGSVPDGHDDADATRDVFVTPAYASPQRLQKQPAQHSDDLYSLGCVAYELFTGRHPFAMVSSREAQRARLRPEWSASIPARHFGVIARMLSWERDQRPASTYELLDSLLAAQARAQAAFTAGALTPSARPEAASAPAMDELPQQAAEPSEDALRAFAQFSGVVPENWVARDTAAHAAAATEPAELRWRKPIPPEWLESPAPSPDGTHVAAAVMTSTQQTEVADRWHVVGPLHWIKRGVELLERRVLPHEDTVDATSDPVSTEPPAPAVSNRWGSLRDSWNTFTARWPAVRAQAAVSAVAAEPVHPDRAWIPQLRWQNALHADWPQLQLATATASVDFQRIEFPGLSQVAAAPLAVKALPQSAEGSTAAGESWQQRCQHGTTQFAHALSSLRKRLATMPQVHWQRSLLADALPHWMHLRRDIATPAMSPAPGVRHWREAMPVAAVASIAIVAMLLLHVSDTVGSASRVAAEQERAFDEQLEQLASAPVPIEGPGEIAMALPEMPSIKVVAPSVAPAPGVVSFQSARVHVSAGQRMAVVNLRREKSTAGAAPVGWSIAAGSARPGVDYELPASQTARFNDGQEVRSLFIPLKGSHASTARHFTVKLRKLPGAPAIGDIAETEVIIDGMR